MSPEAAIKAEIEAVKARRGETGERLDKAHKELQKAQYLFEVQQTAVFRANDRIEALTEALHRLERDQ